MNLYVINHSFHYELENLTRLFFPNEKINVIKENTDISSPCIYTEISDKLYVSVEIGAYSSKNSAPLTDDVENERILKEYVEGYTIFELVNRNEMQDDYINQVNQMCSLLYKANTNIDYFPTNFVVQAGKLFYIDYECNDYMQEWDFEHWGIKYWSKTDEFNQYVHSNNIP